jgi:hypothetical protein
VNVRQRLDALGYESRDHDVDVRNALAELAELREKVKQRMARRVPWHPKWSEHLAQARATIDEAGKTPIVMGSVTSHLFRDLCFMVGIAGEFEP